MKMREIFMLPAVLVVGAALAMAGKTSESNSAKATSQSDTHTTTKATIHHETGTVSSLAANELVLGHTWGGKEEKTKFTLDSATKKEGKIEQGDHVVVYYRFEKGHRIATDLKALGEKPKTETKKS